MFCKNILTTEWHGGLCQIHGRLLKPLTSQAQSRGLGPALQPAPESDILMFLQQRRGLKVSRPNKQTCLNRQSELGVSKQVQSQAV